MTTTQNTAERIATRYLTAGNVIRNGSIPITVTEVTQVAPNRYTFTYTVLGQDGITSNVHGSKTWTRISWGE